MEYGTVADDFFVNMNLQTTLELPDNRETVLHFFEAVQKEFRAMTSFFQRDSGEFVLEGDHEGGSYPWMELQVRRISSGFFNPPDMDEACRMHLWLLDRLIYFLGVSPLDVECLDVLLGFNLDFQGNRDAVVADALLTGSPLGALLSEISPRALECEPTVVLSLDTPCCLQARLSLETRSSSYQVRTGQYADEPVSIYFTIRKYPSPGEVLDLQASFAEQREICEDLACRSIIPNVIQPIAEAIAAQ